MAIGPTERLLLLIPPSDHWLGEVVLVAEDADTCGIQDEMCPASGRQAEPACRQHPQEMRAGKDQDLAVEFAQLSDDQVGSRADGHHAFSVGTPVPEKTPAGMSGKDLSRSQSLVGAVVPLGQLGFLEGS